MDKSIFTRKFLKEKLLQQVVKQKGMSHPRVDLYRLAKKINKNLSRRGFNF